VAEVIIVVISESDFSPERYCLKALLLALCTEEYCTLQTRGTVPLVSPAG
jgi:hypothetical protein